ncbi:DEAD/DEAH box helicase [Aeromicrobium senzhongii]|uniref:ATP-dependent RNA helicase DeaD n=1 Tax=Aeromicrobium senzhongii TaxID=2663859 RepID=A0ABX6SU56_9ACTN|nr:DEAD/DEAH box helicase [Aeromicrobium senzhongii]MTB88363.1 DEAD/DEAH box helicase [Aeromicrobium senzhongii]QNL94663.1 DEAD/DEAH box helicase [Aeromicrobium senzhongii]
MTEAPSETLSFDDLGLDDSLVQVVRALGYETPSPIQAQAIPALLQGGDVVGLAQTGTGKTAAFALPMVQRLDPGSSHTQALVLAPTRELALQVSEAIQSYSSGTGLKVLPVYGGQSYGAQLSGLKRGAQVVVGTPGRVIDHLERGSLDLSALEMLVLDEADEMLNMGFAEDVERILADTPEYKQVALFSATMPPGIRRLAKKYLHDPQDISTPQATRSTTNVRQRWMPVSHHNKLDALTRVLEVEQGDAMLIFVRTKSATEELAEKLRSRGYTVAALNGDLAQAQRERTVGQLKSGVVDIVVATDVAARGLDVDRITHVVNYDIPHDPEAYVHRIGRTGRAGRSGDAIVFVTPRERGMLKSLERVSGRPVEQMAVPTPDEVNAKRADRFAASITTAMGDPEFEVYKGLVEQYAQQHDVDMTDIAAALAVMSQDDKAFFLRPDPPQEKREPREPREKRERTERPSSDGMATYRLAVGKRHKIRPSMVVGALANEGGLKRSDFGKITIGVEHTLVELPADLPDEVFDLLANTRISGKKIDIAPDSGRPGGERKKPYSKPAGKTYSKGSGSSGSYSKPAGKGKPESAGTKKPRHKKD